MPLTPRQGGRKEKTTIAKHPFPEKGKWMKDRKKGLRTF